MKAEIDAYGYLVLLGNGGKKRIKPADFIARRKEMQDFFDLNTTRQFAMGGLISYRRVDVIGAECINYTDVRFERHWGDFLACDRVYNFRVYLDKLCIKIWREELEPGQIYSWDGRQRISDNSELACGIGRTSESGR